MRSSLAAVIMILTSALFADASVILDQEHSFTSAIANSTSGNVAEQGQTFTVGIAGTLDHVDVLMFHLSGFFDPSNDPQLSIYNTAAGLPTGAPLATAVAPKASVPLNTAAFVTFDISAAAIPVTPGEVLAFGVSTISTSGTYFLLADTDTGAADDYLAGAAVSRFPPSAWQPYTPAEDHGFRTFVSTTTLIPGDVNGDHVVNGLDIAVVASHWLLTSATLPQGDANSDGTVNGLDIATIASHWLYTTPTGGSGTDIAENRVPEPATLMLASLGALALFVARNRMQSVRCV